MSVYIGQQPDKVVDTRRELYKPPTVARSHLVTPPNDCLVWDASVATIAEIGGYFFRIPAARNPDLDMTFDCHGTDRFGNADQGVLFLNFSLLGECLDQKFFAEPFIMNFSGGDIKWIESIGGRQDPFILDFSIRPSDAYIPFARAKKHNWVKWSRVGALVFDIGRDNEAGEGALDWNGYVYQVKKLIDANTGNPAGDNPRILVYGEGGVTVMTPHGTKFGMKTISRVGLKGCQAVTGNDFTHWYINRVGEMWQVDDKHQLLGYKEYLSALNNSVVMVYDEIDRVIYACDGNIGFVYNPVEGSLGSAPAKISGIGCRGGTKYVVAPEAVTVPPFEYCSDIYDMGTRRPKTISSVEFMVDADAELWAAIDWRHRKADNFTTTAWVKVNPGGIANLPCYGVEFRVRLKSLVYEDFKLDGIRVNGVVHNSSFTDVFSMR